MPHMLGRYICMYQVGNFPRVLGFIFVAYAFLHIQPPPPASPPPPPPPLIRTNSQTCSAIIVITVLESTNMAHISTTSKEIIKPVLQLSTESAEDPRPTSNKPQLNLPRPTPPSPLHNKSKLNKQNNIAGFKPTKEE